MPLANLSLRFKTVSGIALLALTVSLSAGVAQAQTITDLFNTGVDNAGALLPLAATDPHYTMIANDFSSVSTETFVTENQLVGTWALNPTSQYISVDTGDGSSIAGGGYTVTYRTTFTLPANALLSTVNIAGDWSTDNTGLDILINGVSTGNTSSGFGSFTDFILSTGFYTAGANTLDFIWRNEGAPGGVNVFFTAASYQVSSSTAAPEPGAFALLLPLLGVAAWYRSGRKSAA